jgi:hypothetical protein
MSAYTELAAKLNTYFKDKSHKQMWVPDISTVCGIHVHMVISSNGPGKPYMRLGIETSMDIVGADAYDEDSSKSVELYSKIKHTAKSQITDAELEDLFSDVPKLKFDKFAGKLSVEYESRTVCAFIKTFANVKLSHDECCVCLEETRTKTCCDHYLCYECMDKIKPKFDEESERDVIHCPLCRGHIAE